MGLRGFSRFAKCECGAHIVGVSAYEYEPAIISLNWYALDGYGGATLWERIKIAWKIIVKGNHITHDVVLTAESATEFAEDILEAVNFAEQVTYEDFDARR